MPNLDQRITAVQRRQQRQWQWECLSWGLLGGGVLSIGFGIVRLAADGSFPWAYLVAPLGAGLLAGLAVALFTGGSRKQAAYAIDQACGLKDRIQSALQFSAGDNNDSLRRLQVAEAETHAAEIIPERIVPFSRPKTWVTALSLATVALALLFVSNPAPPVIVNIEVNPVVERQADRLSTELEELKNLQAEEQNPELDQLIAELELILEQIKEPGLEPKEALAKLSEMETSLMQMQQQLEQQQSTTELAEMGEILSLSKDMAQAGEALSKGNLEKAAEELQKLEMPDLDRQTEKAITEQLKQLADDSKQGSPKSKTQDAASQISEGLNRGDRGKFRDGVQGLAGEAKKQARRKKLADLLKKQCQCLSECKSECESECQSNGNKSGKGGNKWGTAASGNESGDKTAKLATNSDMKLKGQESNLGDSEVETLAGDAQEQEALRSYRQQAESYEALSESVLNSESIPLGHRQTIRKYFQLIRPSNEETTKVNQSLD